MTALLFQSTRQGADPGAAPVGFAQALLKGLAPDGGLFVPRQWPVHAPRELCARIGLPPAQYLTAAGLARIGALLLAPLVAGSELAGQLPAITAQAFNFPAPLVPLARATDCAAVYVPATGLNVGVAAVGVPPA